MKILRIVSFVLLTVFAVAVLVEPLNAQRTAQGGGLPYKIFLPMLSSVSCENSEGETYGALTVNPPPTDRPAELHANLNLALRGYAATTGRLGLVDYGGSADNKAPKLFSLFLDRAKDSGTTYEVLVLYASEQRITLKYTREDTVAQGYTLHIEDVCVAPALLDAYRTLNTAGRVQLPALKQGQAFGRAMNTEIGVVIRDTGSFMDPRSEKDWW